MTYTDEQIDAYVERACERFADGLSLRAVAIELGISRTTLCSWLLTDKHAGQYARARLIRADYHADEIHDIKTDCLRGSVAPDVARVAIDATKWQASKMDKERYGDKQMTEITGKDGGDVKISNKITIEVVEPPSAAQVVSHGASEK